MAKSAISTGREKETGGRELEKLWGSEGTLGAQIPDFLVKYKAEYSKVTEMDTPDGNNKNCGKFSDFRA